MKDDILKCHDGTDCDVVVDTWSCCNTRGGRAKCPKNYPNMCLAQQCSDNMDHCCEVAGVCEATLGGLLPCEGKSLCKENHHGTFMLGSINIF